MVMLPLLSQLPIVVAGRASLHTNQKYPTQRTIVKTVIGDGDCDGDVGDGSDGDCDDVGNSGDDNIGDGSNGDCDDIGDSSDGVCDVGDSSDGDCDVGDGSDGDW